MQAMDGGERIFLPWHALQRELADALPAHAHLHTRRRFLRYAESGAGVLAEFAGPDGEVHRVEASLLIGADGGQSAVREQLLGDGPPTYLGAPAAGATGLQGWHVEGGPGGGGAARPPPPACASTPPSTSPACLPSSMPGMAIWRAVRPRPADWPVDVGYVGFGAPGKPTCMTHTIGDGSQLAWQAFSPWPADQLRAIGGGRQAYVQEGTSQGEAAAERLQRALAVFDSYPQPLKGAAPTPSGMAVRAACPWHASAALHALNGPAACHALPQAAADLIATTDPAAVSEHGQFCREPQQCQASGCAAPLCMPA
jgi:hypothetical protein